MIPEITPQSRKKHLKEKYEMIAASYHQARYSDEKGLFDLEQTNRMTLRLLESLGYTDLSKQKILDIATGTGRNLNLLQSRAQKIIGLDYAYEMLMQAKANLSAPLPLIQGDAEHLPFQKQAFDIVLSCRFFHLIPLRLKRICLKEFSRVVKADGIIIIEFINASYFLNLRTFFRTIFKTFTEKDYLSRKTVPFAWKLQFPFLEVQAVSGTWCPGFRSLMKWFPKTRPHLERLMLIAPFNMLSERILVAFSVKQWDKAWTSRGNVSLKTSDAGTVVVKKIRNLSPKNIFQFLKDKNTLKALQNPKPNTFRVLRIQSDSFFKYTTLYEKLHPIGNRENISNLSAGSQKLILDALFEFQARVNQEPVTWIERFDRFFFGLDFAKRLLLLCLEKTISFKAVLKIAGTYFKTKFINAANLRTAVHGDIISGGNLSFGGVQDSEIFILDFEGVRKHEFFLYDLVHIACKNPVQKIFEADWVTDWFGAYISYFKCTWNQETKKHLLLLLQFCFAQALVRRLHERIKVDPSASKDIATTKLNLESSLDQKFLSEWLEKVLRIAAKKKSV